MTAGCGFFESLALTPPSKMLRPEERQWQIYQNLTTRMLIQTVFGLQSKRYSVGF
jgi:hypothetical protein